MNNKPIVDFVIDFETLSTIPNSKLIDMAILPFIEEERLGFSELTKAGFKIKFDLKSQKDRISDPYTIAWWKGQEKSAKENLKPSPSDVTIKEGCKLAIDFMKENGISRDSLVYCRGMSFDFPLFVSMMQEYYDTLHINQHRPYMFWNERDIRTVIESTMGVRGQTVVPLPKGVIDGFVKHDSIHDCAKDVIMMRYAKYYAYGLKEIPEGDNVDPLSIK